MKNVANAFSILVPGAAFVVLKTARQRPRSLMENNKIPYIAHIKFEVCIVLV